MILAFGLVLGWAIQGDMACPRDNPNVIGAIDTLGLPSDYEGPLPIEQLRIVRIGLVISSDPALDGAVLGFMHQLSNGATFFQSREYRLLRPGSIVEVRKILGPTLADVSAESIGSYIRRIDDVDGALRRASAKYAPCIVSTGPRQNSLLRTDNLPQ